MAQTGRTHYASAPMRRIKTTDHNGRPLLSTYAKMRGAAIGRRMVRSGQSPELTSPVTEFKFCERCEDARSSINAGESDGQDCGQHRTSVPVADFWTGPLLTGNADCHIHDVIQSFDPCLVEHDHEGRSAYSAAVQQARVIVGDVEPDDDQ